MDEIEKKPKQINNSGNTGKKMSAIDTSSIIRENEALRKSEERYHKMIDEVEDYAILLLDKDGIIQNWNKGAEKIKGYKDVEIVGQNFRIFYLAEDREKKLPEQLIDEAVRNGKAIHEGWRLRKDGTRFWGSIVITALHDEQNGIIGFSKVTRDLTTLKLASDQINNYARQLEFQNKELQQFAYAAAHDMKEPLRKVQFYNSMIVESIGDKLSGKEKSYLNSSITSVARMSSLIDDLLLYSEVSSANDKFERLDLVPVIKETVAFFKESLDDGTIELECAETMEIWGIAFQIRQLFENLIGNAIKYRHKEHALHIQVVCSLEYLRISTDPEFTEANAYFRIEVRDNGIGFEQEYAQRIFELFQRLYSKAEYPGTGVGLAICKKIVQNHRGSIEAQSTPDHGAVFTVYLPKF